MAGSRQFLVVLFFTAGIKLCVVPACAGAESYNLRDVKGIEAFGGSTAAREILGRNGFVVADPAFRQIFEAYIKSPETEKPSENAPMGKSLPSFITTDSAWHTYHVLLEEGVKRMEEVQSRRLLSFSSRLLVAVTNQNVGTDASDLALFASVGLALQDEHFRQTLGPEAKRIVDALRNWSMEIDVPIGFNLSPLQFRAQSFYTQSPELSDYFAARQWYASVVFRLSNPRETRFAIALARLMDGNPDLLALWKELSDPYDALLATAEDGTVREYAEAAIAVLRTNNAADFMMDGRIVEIQKRLEDQLALPRVSDQLLSPQQYAEYGKQTRGFRLLPPRRLPCAICFQNTIDPKIPGRAYPSGLDFLAASPVLRSPAAVRAVQNQYGKSISDLILKTDCGPMPDSLHGEAMQLLSTLQKPLPAKAPSSMRNEAWADLQLWTQLGAWAEQRHTWALHTKLSVSYAGIITPPKGMVAPYPEFFSGLANLTRRTAEAFDKAGLESHFDVKTVAKDLQELLILSHGMSSIRDEKEMEKLGDKLEQLNQFQERYYEQHRKELEEEVPRDAYQRLEKELEDLAHRCAESGTANEADTETLRSFFECRQSIVRLLNGFAPVCDRLAVLARKSLAGDALSEDDAKWIKGYGVTLAGFHFYYGNSYEVPRDDFPIVTRVFSNPLTDSMLYAGLARPQALYVIVSDGNAKQLYRGAVMTYREFVRPNDHPLEDESWRELVSSGRTPPPPPFTRSFYAEMSADDLIQRLHAQNRSDDVNYADIRDTLWQIGSRATDKDLPDLIKALRQFASDKNSEIVEDLAGIIGRLGWESCQKQIFEMLASGNGLLQNAATLVLTTRPAALDPATLVSGFGRQPTRTRRLYCVILGGLPQQTDVTRNLMLQALRDREDGVRWQAAMAIGKAGSKDPQTGSALLESLNDTNEFVAAVAAHSLVQLKATNSAPALLAKLKLRLQSTNTSIEELEHQSMLITTDIHEDAGRGNTFAPLDPDNLAMRYEFRVPELAREMASLRLPPRPFAISSHAYSLTDALIESLGDLSYTPAADELLKLQGTDYDAQATVALKRLAPERLIAGLLAVARDKQGDSYLREQAMLKLSRISATNCIRDLVPLLDDTTPIIYSRRPPGAEWRICDRAATTISILLGWRREMETMSLYLRDDQREAMMTRVREWAKSAP